MSDMRILFRSFIKETALGKQLRRRRYNKRLGNRNDAEKMFDIYVGNDISSKERELMLNDMVHMSKKYRYGYDEYFLYHFSEKALSDRLAFIADLDRIDIVEGLNTAINQPLFDDKARTYKKYSKYYKRSLCQIRGGGIWD